MMKNLLNKDQIDEFKLRLSHVKCPYHPTRLISEISLKKNAQQKKGCVECKNKNKLEDPIDFQLAIDQILEAQNDLKEYLDQNIHLLIEKTLPEIQQKLIQYIESAKSFFMQQRTQLQNKINLDKIQELYKGVMANCRENHFDELQDFTIQWFEKSNKYGIQRSEYYENIKIEQNQTLFEQMDMIKINIGEVFNGLNDWTKFFINKNPLKPLDQPPINPIVPIKIKINPKNDEQQKPVINIEQGKKIAFNQQNQKLVLLQTSTIKFQTSEDLFITKILLPQVDEFNEDIYFYISLNKEPNQKISFKQMNQNDDAKWHLLKSPLKITKNTQHEITLQKIDLMYQMYSYQFQGAIQLDHFTILDAQHGKDKCLILRGFEYVLGN
ncbi:hypothetical protein pb186bvf_013163 [Paramecium bursaria]